MRKRLLIFVSLMIAAFVLVLMLSCENSVTPPSVGKMHILVYGNDYQYGRQFFFMDGTFVG